jgi:Homing endonuclease associated repeat
MSNVSREEIIAAVKECARTLGRTPTYEELRESYPAIRIREIQRQFGSYRKVLEDSGVPARGMGFEVTIDKMFLDWAEIVRKTGKIPTRAEYDRHSQYSVRPLTRLFGKWSQIPSGLHKYAQQAKMDVEYGDVLNVIRQHYEGDPQSAWTSAGTEETLRNTLRLQDRPIYGPPLSPAHLACGPTNEAGVIFLFGMLAGQLGFVVTRIQTEFPDCEALRQVSEEKWQRVKIEFEYESRNFLRHYHNADDCDLIVCWKHNWQDCPLEVVELKGAVGKLVPR